MTHKQNEYNFLHVPFWQWVELNPSIKRFMFAVEHGEVRNVRVGVKLKRKGVKGGMLDYFFMKPSGKYIFLWIEFKFGKNKLSAAQKEFIKIVEEAGGKAICCYEVEEAIKGVSNYIAEGFE